MHISHRAIPQKARETMDKMHEELLLAKGTEEANRQAATARFKIIMEGRERT